jgi:hypothetical protein
MRFYAHDAISQSDGDPRTNIRRPLEVNLKSPLGEPIIKQSLINWTANARSVIRPFNRISFRANSQIFRVLIQSALLDLGPVWTILYLLMAIAAWRVWLRPAVGARRAALIWFAGPARD